MKASLDYFFAKYGLVNVEYTKELNERIQMLRDWFMTPEGQNEAIVLFFIHNLPPPPEGKEYAEDAIMDAIMTSN